MASRARAVYRCQQGHPHRSARSAALCDRPSPSNPEAYADWLRRSYEPETRQEAPRG